ncbi:MAG: hypothetical protein ACOVMQ_07770 [Cyclobacteriaceae bacterium]|jgi:hypothetical protein
MSPLAYLPFFYFQKTRLNNAKAFIFHGAYEWVPVFLLAFYYFPAIRTLADVLLYYVAFISIYEIGYLANDQHAHTEAEGRKRTEKLAGWHIALFVSVRLAAFLVVTVVEGQFSSGWWWGWYGLLAIQFFIHNQIQIRSLKSITFSFLAFIRFLSPIFMLIPAVAISTLLLPIFLNYVLFRLFTYLDSKDFLKNFDRKSGAYYRGFYLLIVPFSIIVAVLMHTWLPLIFTGYYALVALGFSLLASSAQVASE